MSDVTNQGCPVAGCILTRSSHHIMCASHWYQVPRTLRSRVRGLLSNNNANPFERERIFAAAVEIAGDLLANPRRVIHAAKELTRIEGIVTLTSLSKDLIISKKRAASIIELMINVGFIDDGDYLGIYHLHGARHENRN